MQTLINKVSRSGGQLPYHLMAEVAAGEPGHEATGHANVTGESDGVLPRTGGAKVLIADDSLTERTNLTRIVQAAGYEVITAGSGNEAVALAIEHEPAVIFLDIIMDDGDGYKACRNIKRNATTAAIPVIMVSSKSNAVDQKWAERLGASSYVIKPYSDDEILQKLEGV